MGCGASAAADADRMAKYATSPKDPEANAAVSPPSACARDSSNMPSQRAQLRTRVFSLGPEDSKAWTMALQKAEFVGPALTRQPTQVVESRAQSGDVPPADQPTALRSLMLVISVWEGLQYKGELVEEVMAYLLALQPFLTRADPENYQLYEGMSPQFDALKTLLQEVGRRSRLLTGLLGQSTRQQMLAVQVTIAALVKDHMAAEVTEELREPVTVVEQRRRQVGLEAAVHNALRPFDFSAEVAALSKTKGVETNTRSWAFDMVRDILRRRSTQRAIVFVGPGGNGKSMLSVMVCERFHDHVLAMYLCRGDDVARQDPRTAVLTLACQLFIRLPGYARELLEMLKRRATRGGLCCCPTAVLWMEMVIDPLLRLEAPDPSSKIAILLDSIDESPELALLIHDYVPLLPSWLVIIATSASPVDLGCLTARASLAGELQRSDMVRYLYSSLPFHVDEDSTVEGIADMLARKSQANALYLALVQEQVLRFNSEVVAQLPASLPAWYHSFIQTQLQALEAQSVSAAPVRAVLRVLVAAREPLDLQCIEEMLEEYEESLIADVVKALKPVLSMRASADDTIICFAHHTLRDWLTCDECKQGPGQEYYIDPVKAQQRLAQVCCTALQQGTRRRSKPLAQRLSVLALEDVIAAEPGTLLRYAVVHAGAHAITARDWNLVRTLFGNTQYWYLRALMGCAANMEKELSDAIRSAQEDKQTDVLDLLREAWRLFTQTSVLWISQPQVFLQVARSQPHSGILRKNAASVLEALVPGTVPWIEWANVPESAPALLSFFVVASSETWQGHEVTSAAVSHNGKRLAVLWHTAQVWDLDSGQMIISAECTGASVTLSSHGTTAYIGASDRVREFIVDARTEGKSPLAHSAGLAHITCSPDNRRLAFVGRDLIVRVWDMAQIAFLPPLRGHAAPVTSISWGPESRRLVSGAEDGSVRVFNVETGKEIAGTSHQKRVFSVAYSGDARFVASASADATVKLLFVSGDREVVLRSPGAAATMRLLSVAISPDSSAVAGGGSDGVVRIWSSATAELIRQFPAHPDPVVFLSFLPDQRLLTAAGRIVRIWGIELPRAEGERKEGEEVSLTAPATKVQHAALSPDGSTLLYGDERTVCMRELPSCKVLDVAAASQAHFLGSTRHITLSRDGIAMVWHDRATNQTTPFESGASKVIHIACAPDGSRFVVCALDRSLRVFNGADANMEREETSLHSCVQQVAFLAPDGSRALLLFVDGSAALWSLTENMRLLDLPGAATGQCVADRGSAFALCIESGEIITYSGTNGAQLSCISDLHNGVDVVRLSPDGDVLVTATDGLDDGAFVWGARDGRKMKALSGESSANYTAFCFSPDGAFLLGADESGVISVWDTKDWQLRLQLAGHTASPVRRLVIDRGGTRLLSVGAETVIWDIGAGFQQLLHQQQQTREKSAQKAGGPHVPVWAFKQNWCVEHCFVLRLH